MISHERKVLIAVDESNAAMHAVRYVAAMLSPEEVDVICLLHVYPEPPPDYYTRGGILGDYRKKRELSGHNALVAARKILLEAGLAAERICTDIRMADKTTISQMVLDVQQEGDFGTVVAGKRGVSKAEEFLFGSISNALARHCKNFTAWIVG